MKHIKHIKKSLGFHVLYALHGFLDVRILPTSLTGGIAVFALFVARSMAILSINFLLVFMSFMLFMVC